MLRELSEIRRRRKRLDMTQSALARKAGVSQSLIAKIESGRIDPTYTKVKSILDVLEALEQDNGGRARDIMSRKVIMIDKGARLAEAIRLMKQHNISQMPVLNRGHVIGAISEKAILDIVSESEDPSALSRAGVEHMLEEAMPRVGPNTPLQAISALLKGNDSVLIAEGENIIGIITKADMMKMIR